jgi:16S rRNA (adenine1518-N6/adenine1519-N6)-dimethyltransferase
VMTGEGQNAPDSGSQDAKLDDGSSLKGGLPFSFSRSEILSELKLRGFRFDPRKGQNFLFDGNLLRALVRDAEIPRGMPILEIGPGAGTLTRALLETGSSVLAVEIDRILAGYLRETFSGSSLEVVEADALETKNRLSAKLLGALPEGEFQLVANLPYAIASPLVCLLVEACPQMSGFSVLVQQEVADRWVADPGCREYGTSSVLLSRLGEGRITRKVPPHAFIPAPRVDSAFIRWQRKIPAPDQPRQWMNLVRACFQGRRKSMARLLGQQGYADWKESGLDGRIRPDQLSPDQWADLARILMPENAQNGGDE